MVRKQISFEITPAEHYVIKLMAAQQGKSIREFIIEAIKEKLEQVKKD